MRAKKRANSVRWNLALLNLYGTAEMEKDVNMHKSRAMSKTAEEANKVPLGDIPGKKDHIKAQNKKEGGAVAARYKKEGGVVESKAHEKEEVKAIKKLSKMHEGMKKGGKVKK